MLNTLPAYIAQGVKGGKAKMIFPSFFFYIYLEEIRKEKGEKQNQQIIEAFEDWGL